MALAVRHHRRCCPQRQLWRTHGQATEIPRGNESLAYDPH